MLKGYNRAIRNCLRWFIEALPGKGGDDVLVWIAATSRHAVQIAAIRREPCTDYAFYKRSASHHLALCYRDSVLQFAMLLLMLLLNVQPTYKNLAF